MVKISNQLEALAREYKAQTETVEGMQWRLMQAQTRRIKQQRDLGEMMKREKVSQFTLYTRETFTLNKHGRVDIGTEGQGGDDD